MIISSLYRLNDANFGVDLVPIKSNLVLILLVAQIERHAVIVQVVALGFPLRSIVSVCFTMDVELDGLLLQVSRRVCAQLRSVLERNDMTAAQMHMEVVRLSVKCF